MSQPPPTGPGGPTPPGGPGEPEDLGTVAEEAAKLLGALGDWARDQGTDWAQGAAGLADHAATTARQVRDHLDDNLANGSEECRYCPVCRTIHAVRQMSPEVKAHLTTAATSLLQAAAGAMATQVPSGSTGAQPGRSGVEHIDLDDDGSDDPADPGSQSEQHDQTDPSDPDPETHA
ncbi:hypothetical protein GCM10027270_07320 [Nocardioides ginkgobilobae]